VTGAAGPSRGILRAIAAAPDPDAVRGAGAAGRFEGVRR